VPDSPAQPPQASASRFGAAAFAILVVATVAAFFITQALKVSLPLIAGDPMPFPAAINPVSGHTCWAAGPHGKRKRASYRFTRFSFYLQYQADYVDVDVINRGRKIIRTVATRRYMRTDRRYPDGSFSWNGRENNGTIAPDGAYNFRINLVRQHRTIVVNKPITITTERPRPLVTSVSPPAITRNASAIITIRYTGTEGRSATIVIYRLDRDGPRVVKTYVTKAHDNQAIWDGTIHRHRAPAGIYLVGLDVTDKACTTGAFPVALRDVEASAPQAIVRVR
jgi:hypothetical protein